MRHEMKDAAAVKLLIELYLGIDYTEHRTQNLILDTKYKKNEKTMEVIPHCYHVLHQNPCS